jgi:L-seryl-tRNA(Ser) seleniumtransferase
MFSLTNLNRRQLFQSGGVAAAGLFAAQVPEAAAAASTSNLYESIGVRPMINAYGVMTIIGGSLTLPEVKRAMEEASNYFVHLDELAEAVGNRLAELTKAEWGIVTSGCAAAMTHATSACIAGADPEKLQRLPDLTGLKNQVIVPKYSRNVYDHAVRMLGVKMVEVANKEEFEAAFNHGTAMIYVLEPLNPRNKDLGLEVMASIAKRKGVPILVDAAAERLTIPNEYLTHGADMVCYSGGKLLHGPQCAGLLLGRKDLLQAAWYNGAPHHAFGRPMKVGKEEVMGMLAAVEMWTKRDHDAEWKQWESWCRNIGSQVSKVAGVQAEITPPNEGPVAPSPHLRISWDAEKIGLTAAEVTRLLLDGTPRIVVPPARRRPGTTGEAITISPIMMMPGEDKVVAESVYAILSKPPKVNRPAVPTGAPANVAGQWTAKLEFFTGTGSAEHAFTFEQEGSQIRGTHRGQWMSGDLQGSVRGNLIEFRSSHRYEGSSLNYAFTGTVDASGMHGTVTDVSTITPVEYGPARWTATRHAYVGR